jgi:hypothetical protein
MAAHKEYLMSQFIQDFFRISHLITRPEDRKLFADKLRHWRKVRREQRETKVYEDPYFRDENFRDIEGPVYVIANGGQDVLAFHMLHHVDGKRWPYVPNVAFLKTLPPGIRFIMFPNAERRADAAEIKKALIELRAINIVP